MLGVQEDHAQIEVDLMPFQFQHGGLAVADVVRHNEQALERDRKVLKEALIEI